MLAIEIHDIDFVLYFPLNYLQQRQLLQPS